MFKICFNFSKREMDVLASTNCSIAKISFDSFSKCIGGPLLEVIERNKVKVFKNKNKNKNKN